MSDFSYSLVITSCQRFDLLRRTVQSLREHLDVLPSQFVIVEDSGDAAVKDAVSDLGFDIEFLVNSPRLGQTRAIDKAYGRVTSDFVFHCEDDWEFFRGGFINESLSILSHHADVSMVGLRSRAELNPLVRNLPSRKLDRIEYFLFDPSLHAEYFSYSFNPGLRRMKDYRAIGPFEPIGQEQDVSYRFKKAGFRIANLENPAVRHIGDERHVEDPTQPKKAKSMLDKLARSIRKRTKRLRRLLSGD